jgi:hypothetical protein
MMNNYRRFMVVFAMSLVSLIATVSLRASDPVGVYALVEKVVLEPNDNEPVRAQIWGAFALSDGTSGDGYVAPQVGYLYYSCALTHVRMCRNEWSDLKAVAGRGTGVGFGGRYLDSGRVRKAAEKPANPDEYPIKMGVVRMGTLHDQSMIMTKLKLALEVDRQVKR